MSNTDKQLTQEQLSAILDLHVKWLRNEPGGVQANLHGANLSYANLSYANLSYADLSDANLSGADLSDANLSGANLSDANLSGADLSDANLSDADLYGANLFGANLSRTYYLSEANLRGAKLPPPVLDLTDCKVGFKKVWNKDRSKQVVIELRFPEGTKLVSTVIGRKCRASEAVVGRCLTPGCEKETEFWSLYDGSFTYKVGENVLPVMAFNDSITEECASGIHFFTTPEEAEAYRW